MFARLETYLYLLTRQVMRQGYHPNPTKSLIIVRLDNIKSGKVFGARHVFRVCTGARYLGGLHWVQQVPTRLIESAHADVGE